MKKHFTTFFIALLMLCCIEVGSNLSAYAYVRQAPIERSKVRPHRVTKGEYAESGKSAERGGAGFGKNIAKGHLTRAGKEFGKGMGGFGKHLGLGIGKSVAHVFKP